MHVTLSECFNCYHCSGHISVITGWNYFFNQQNLRFPWISTTYGPTLVFVHILFTIGIICLNRKKIISIFVGGKLSRQFCATRRKLKLQANIHVSFHLSTHRCKVGSYVLHTSLSHRAWWFQHLNTAAENVVTTFLPQAVENIGFQCYPKN